MYIHTFEVIVSRAAKAEFKIGIAWAKSESHSSLIALAAEACSLATSSSPFTTFLIKKNNFIYKEKIQNQAQ